MRFKHLHSRIAVTFLTLILIIQVLGFGAIRVSIERKAVASVDEQLQVGERIFRNILRQNGENLSQASSILAADFGFRQAVASDDEETIRSAVINQQARIGANIAIFFPANSSRNKIFGSLETQEALGTVSALVGQAAKVGASSDFAVFHNHPHQVVLVPVKAPITIGWVLMGFQIDDALAKKLSRLTNLEVTFISRNNPSSPWISSASTHSLSSLKQLLSQVPSVISQKISSSKIELQDGDFGTRYIEILNEGGEPLYVVLQRSISEAAAPFETLQWNLLILTLLGALVFVAGSFFTAKKITKPISDLAETAAQLERGNFDVEINTSREDEIGNLSRAFKRMAEAISSREKSILKLAYLDEMTNLPNRVAFMNSVGKAIARSNETQQSFSVLMLDLDRFKQINSVLGHSVADELLRIVADRVKSSIKDSTDEAARLGGDEFAVLLNNCSVENALNVSRRLSHLLETPFNISDQSVDMSAGIGIVSYPENADTVEQIMSRAEIAMYHAKSRNNGAVVFTPQLDITSKNNLSLASELKAAIEENQFSLYVQPKINLKTGQVASVEGLIRWIHPEKGFVFPDQFIPFAEQTGHIRKISQWMLTEAARFAVSWNAESVHVPIAINLSARDLMDADLPDSIAKILKQAGISQHMLTLEITESSMMDDPVRAQATLEKLSQMGIRLAIDDFGTGYSSLAYLKRLPIDELKIDKSFVLKMDQDINDIKIVRSTIDLGHNLGLQVVAEGIENKMVWDLLEGMGCDYGQGYFMSKPMPAKDFLAWLKNWKLQQINTVKSSQANTFVENQSNTLN